MIEKNTRIVDILGFETQSTIWVEELSELTKVICKWNRCDDLDYELKEELLDEMTDVLICIDQMKYLSGISSSDLKKHYKKKLIRRKEKVGY